MVRAATKEERRNLLLSSYLSLEIKVFEQSLRREWLVCKQETGTAWSSASIGVEGRRGGLKTQKVAMTITGHKTESVYRRYDIVTQDDVKAAVSKIEGRKPTTLDQCAAHRISYGISYGASKQVQNEVVE